ncbi:MAG: CofH family radical SAM protein [Bacteroidales bacterium]|jgi:aminodeoxyfutalosine synthase|nr:CofH family radical SAM protein [Bacteroidales bacterium]
MIKTIIENAGDLKQTAKKIYEGERLTFEDGVSLYNSSNLPLLASLSLFRKKQISGNKVFFNRNFHIEPANICIFACKFCSYRRKKGDKDAWDFDIPEMIGICTKYAGKGITEVHIVGGVHPYRDIHFYGELIQKIKTVLPDVHIKGFTAVELDYMIRNAGYGIEQGLRILKNYGLNSIPGGGAEIFNEDIRRKICGDKAPAQVWLQIHELAHNAGLPSNASMLYGHVETYEHRIDHLDRLRQLQDKTGGFNAFIPLKYKNINNSMSNIGEINTAEVMKNFAVCRLYLDNIPHIKSYWPMLGKGTAQMALNFGADDVDGTIDDSTKIYSMAGSEETSPIMTVSEMLKFISSAGFTPIERDSLYNEIFPIME